MTVPVTWILLLFGAYGILLIGSGALLLAWGLFELARGLLFPTERPWED